MYASGFMWIVSATCWQLAEAVLPEETWAYNSYQTSVKLSCRVHFLIRSKKKHNERKAVSGLNQFSTTQRRHREWRYSSIIIDLGNTWRQVVSFTPRSLYPMKDSPYPMHRKLAEPQSRSGRCGAEEMSLASAENQTLSVLPLAPRYSDWFIPVYKQKIMPKLLK
jgi:hypothetical protein